MMAHVAKAEEREKEDSFRHPPGCLCEMQQFPYLKVVLYYDV